LQELVTSPKGKRVIAAVLAVLRNNTLTPLQYLKGQPVPWRVSGLPKLDMAQLLSCRERLMLAGSHMHAHYKHGQLHFFAHFIAH
jgi:hypothetical protein